MRLPGIGRVSFGARIVVVLVATLLLMQLATIIAVVLPLTLIVGVLPTAALAAVSRGMSLHVPTGMVLSSIIALLLVIAASAMGAIGGVRARDRAVSTLI